jgi:hypothetical protein
MSCNGASNCHRFSSDDLHRIHFSDERRPEDVELSGVRHRPDLGGGDAIVDASVLGSGLSDVQVRDDVAVVGLERAHSQGSVVNYFSAVGVPEKLIANVYAR